MRISLCVLLFILMCCSGCENTSGVFSVELKAGKSQTVKLIDKGLHRATVLYFISPECPLCQGYSLTLRYIAEKYKNNNVLFAGIVPGTFYSDEEIEQFKIRYQIPFEIYNDASKKMTHKLKAHITPEVFLLDEKGDIIYSGKIDDWAEATGVYKQIVTQHYLTDALDAFLIGKKINVVTTKAVGCIIE